MSAPRGVTVFVRRQHGVFLANTLQADAVAISATHACRKCAATHYGVDESKIELTPAGDSAMLAHVKQPEGLQYWLWMAVCTVGPALIVLGLYFFLWRGGVR